MLQEVLDNVQRFCGYRMLRICPSDRLRWLANRGVLRDVLVKLDINCVLDVGANRGRYGMALRGIGYKGWILSFEPIKANCKVLQDVAKRNGPWRVFQYALGAVNDRLLINVTERSVFSSFLTPREDSQRRFPQNRVERREEVELRRLDEILPTCLSGIVSPRIYLKMDTQGFDLEVVKGAESFLSRILALQTEVSFRSIYTGMPGFTESINELQVRGFDVVIFFLWPRTPMGSVLLNWIASWLGGQLPAVHERRVTKNMKERLKELLFLHGASPEVSDLNLLKLADFLGVPNHVTLGNDGDNPWEAVLQHSQGNDCAVCARASALRKCFDRSALAQRLPVDGSGSSVQLFVYGFDPQERDSELVHALSDGAFDAVRSWMGARINTALAANTAHSVRSSQG